MMMMSIYDDMVSALSTRRGLMTEKKVEIYLIEQIIIILQPVDSTRLGQA